MTIPELLSSALDSLGRGYPRPQLRRATWYSLNGEWEFAADPDGVSPSAAAVEWTDRIVVPFVAR